MFRTQYKSLNTRGSSMLFAPSVEINDAWHYKHDNAFQYCLNKDYGLIMELYDSLNSPNSKYKEIKIEEIEKLMLEGK